MCMLSKMTSAVDEKAPDDTPEGLVCFVPQGLSEFIGQGS